MLKKLFSLIFLLNIFLSNAQENDKTTIFKNGIEKPSILTTHHFGLFSARINSNFKITPPKTATLNFSIESGNTFHPFLEMYLPKDPQVRIALSQVNWFDRNFTFIDQETTPAEYENIVIDAVIKGFRVDYNFKINKENELGITLRSYKITKGKYPFSFFTSDESLEWFHSNIAGGEDPFGRRYYGLNQVNFKFTDRNGRVLELKNGDFFMGGIEINHFYYPEFLINKKRNLHINFGSHLGINTTKFNPSIDFGISANAVKKINIKSKNNLNFGLGISVLRKNLINIKNNRIDLGNNKFLGTLEGELEYTKYTEKGNYNAFGINYQIQTRYRKVAEASYYKLIGLWREINAGWHNGFSTLYQNVSNWTFLYTYGTPKYKLTLYLKEDLLVNNAPDLQTGISLKIPLSKK